MMYSSNLAKEHKNSLNLEESSTLPQIRGVIFDMDGVITDTIEYHYHQGSSYQILSAVDSVYLYILEVSLSLSLFLPLSLSLYLDGDPCAAIGKFLRKKFKNS